MTRCDQQQKKNAILVAIFILLKIDIEEERLGAPELMCLIGLLALFFLAIFTLFFTQKLMYEHRFTFWWIIVLGEKPDWLFSTLSFQHED